MVVVMWTIQIGNPVGQPQIIPISGDLHQNEKLRCLHKKSKDQTCLQMLGAVSTVQQVWHEFKGDLKLPSFARGSTMLAERRRLSRFSQRPANVTNFEEVNALMVGTTLHPWSINQDLHRVVVQAREIATAMAYAEVKTKRM